MSLEPGFLGHGVGGLGQQKEAERWTLRPASIALHAGFAN